MADKINFEYENPENVEAEVPSTQNIRRSVNNENGESELLLNAVETIKSYSASEVVDGNRQPIANSNGENSNNDEKKNNTKIPVSRFRQTVERVKAERRESKERESQIPIRRSSIPKHKTPPIKPVRKINKPEAIEIATDTITAEDEFDKLYEEVVCSTPTPVNLDVSLLNPKVDDPEKVENTFEEIIHDYDENKVQPIDVEKIKRSRIPFLKRKSLQDLDIQGDRSSKIIAARDKVRLRHNSLKSDDQIRYNKDKIENTVKNNKINDKSGEKSPKIEVKSQYIKTVITSTEANEENGATKVFRSTTEVESIESNKIRGQIIEENIYKDSIKIGIPVFDSYTQESVEEIKIDEPVEVKRIISYSSYNEVIDSGKVEAKLEIIKINNEPLIAEVANGTENTDKINGSRQPDDTMTEILIQVEKKHPEYTKVVMKEKDGDIEDVAKLRGKVGRLISEIDTPNNEAKRKIYIDTEFPKKKSVLSKIAMFERQDVKSKIPKRGTKLPKLLTTNTQRTEKNHVHTPLIVEEVFKPFQAITDLNDTVNKVKVSTNGDAGNLTQIVRAEMIIVESPETVHFEEENKVQIEPNSLFIQHSEVIEEVLTPVLNKSEPEYEKIDKTDKKEMYKDIAQVIQHSEVIEKVLTPVLRKSEPEYEKMDKTDKKEMYKDIAQVPSKIESKVGDITNDNNKELFKNTNKDVPVLIPNFVPVREVLKRYESLNKETQKNKSIDLPKVRPISEIVNDLKPKENVRSLDALFAHQTRPISEILYDLHTPEIQNKIENEVFTYNEVNNDTNKNFKDDFDDVFATEEIKIEHNSKIDDTINKVTSKQDKDIKNNIKTTIKSHREYKTLESRDDNFRSLQFIQDYVKSKENVIKSKSLAQLDLGDAVKGKVNKIIVSINSIDTLEEVKTPIKLKELPRKRSVSEKIALFERKLTPAKAVQPQPTKQETQQTEELTADIQDKIAELSNAKKYGKMDVPSIELANGVNMPVLAVGTALIDSRLVYHVVCAAIDLGYRAIDTAYIYGNEKAIGEAIRAKINDGTVKREELFIISKLWSTFHRTDLVKVACEASLQTMGLEYFDLYLIHNPMSFKEGGSPFPKIATVLQYSEYDYLDAWFGMEGLGSKARAIGVSNFNLAQIRRVMDRARVKPVINQVECHPYNSQQRLDLVCDELNITLSCFGVLGSKGTPQEYKSSNTAVIDDALVQVMASGLNVSPAQLLIRYQIECGHNVVVKSSSAAHLWDNLQALTFNLTSAQVDALHALNRNKRTFTFKGMGDTHKNYPFNAAF